MAHSDKRLTVIALCVLLLAVASGSCNSEVKASAGASGDSSLSQPPPDLMKIIDSQVQPLVESKGRVGVVVGIIDGDKQWVVGYGRKSVGVNTPPDGDSVFEIGSVTKTFTAAALEIMSEKGQVNLKDPVTKFLPKSVRMPSFKGKKITLEHLATQTSGLPRIPDDIDNPKLCPPLNPYSLYTEAHVYKYLRRCRLSKAPGVEYEYSNLGVGLLGLALSRARHSSYENTVTSLVCKPLGMKDTVMTLSKDQRARSVSRYTLEKQDGSLKPVPIPSFIMHDGFAGAGALRSTAKDMLRYLAANIGTTQTPLKQSLQSTHKARHKIDNDLSIGLTWHILKLPDIEPVIWHNGSTMGNCSFVAFCKGRKVGVVLLSNTTCFEEMGDSEAEDAVALGLMLILMDYNKK